MSMPKIEKSENPIDRNQAVSNLVQSIALMETGLAHIINAEGEKIQKVVQPDTDVEVSIDDLLKVNDSVGKMVNSVSKLEMILQNKLDTSKDMDVENADSTGLNAFGGIYNNLDNSISGIAGVPVLVEMPFNTPSKKLSFTTPNSITIVETGSYYITYEMLASFSVAANLTVTLRANGTNITSTETSISVGAVAPVYYSGTAILDLTAGTVIDMAVISDVDMTMSFDSTSIQGINVFKLN
jgi:hypothetical protein